MVENPGFWSCQARPTVAFAALIANLLFLVRRLKSTLKEIESATHKSFSFSVCFSFICLIRWVKL